MGCKTLERLWLSEMITTAAAVTIMKINREKFNKRFSSFVFRAQLHDVSFDILQIARCTISPALAYATDFERELSMHKAESPD